MSFYGIFHGQLTFSTLEQPVKLRKHSRSQEKERKVKGMILFGKDWCFLEQKKKKILE